MPPTMLKVEALPKNSLAYSNCVYINPSTYQTLIANITTPPLLLTVSDQVYTCTPHKDVTPTGIALNGLQRRLSQLTLNQSIYTDTYTPDVNSGLSSINVCVDLLSKVKSSNKVEIDTDELAVAFSNAYGSQMFGKGQYFAMDFKGEKFEVTVDDIEGISTDGSKEEGLRLGQLLTPTIVNFTKKSTVAINLTGSKVSSSSSGVNLFTKNFDFAALGIGGLDEEFNMIFRRAFASRIWPPHIVKQMGINHVRGMLLYGPPGCGKTLIARQIGKALNARAPKIVNGPEILDKFVGGSEEKIRDLFKEAEKEQAELGDGSMLHIIILDEMDAICKKRGSSRDGTGVSDSVVNQLLSKIDGVDSLNNILLIGMTNRMDMIDDALLRPGRLEVHVEIGLPDEQGRGQILDIHTKSMITAGRCNADVKQRMPEIAQRSKNFSGAELEGLVKSASSFALTRAVDVKDLSKLPNIDDLEVSYSDFDRALNEVTPKFGSNNKELSSLYRGGIVNYGSAFTSLQETLNKIILQVKHSSKTPLLSVLLEGSPSSGKTALAAHAAAMSGYPFVRMIAADTMIGASEASKCQQIHQAFMDSYKSPLSLIFIDDIERLIEYVPIGPRFSNAVLQTLLVLLKKPPPDADRKLLIFGTTSIPRLLEDLGLTQAFSLSQHVPLLEVHDESSGDGSEVSPIEKVLIECGSVQTRLEARNISRVITQPIGIRKLLTIVEMALSNSKKEEGPEVGNVGEGIDLNVFMECLNTVGY